MQQKKDWNLRPWPAMSFANNVTAAFHFFQPRFFFLSTTLVFKPVKRKRKRCRIKEIFMPNNVTCCNKNSASYEAFGNLKFIFQQAFDPCLNMQLNSTSKHDSTSWHTCTRYSNHMAKQITHFNNAKASTTRKCKAAVIVSKSQQSKT